MSFLTPNIFYWGQPGISIVATTEGGADPQLQFFENFPGHSGAAFVGVSNQGTLSVHAVNIPLSISFNNVVVLQRFTPADSRTQSVSFGLYSLNGNTLSLANSASAVVTYSAASTGWLSFVTSATQNITPGTWYFAVNVSSSGVAGWEVFLGGG